MISKDKLCYYCYGCNKMELEYFNGTRNCRNFTSVTEEWEKQWREELKKNGNK